MIILIIFGLDRMYNEEYKKATKAYLVYLNGEKVGLINDNKSLYDLINNEQQEIKNKYNVDNVYPPTGFEITEVNTYDEDFITVNNVYEKVAALNDFTIKGYIVTIKLPDEDKVLTINILDKDVFEQAIRKFILAFISEEELTDYLEGKEKELVDIGSIIQKMYFNETITIKEGYISSNAKIYTDVESLSQYLLFGENAKMDTYTVEVGDNIESISDKYDLNPQEFIIANPTYRNTTTLLKVGTQVNVTLLNPVLTFVYEVYSIEETSVPYSKKTVTDKSKPIGFSEKTTPGVAGIRLDYKNYRVKNGEQSSEIKIERSEVIREVIDEITTVGPKRPVSNSGVGTYVDTGTEWGWPTLQPSVITSKFAMRWGKLHAGIDISGTGYGSPIFAINDGVVVNASKACKSCAQWANGNYVVIQHENNYYSAYLHLSAFSVKVGDVVKKGDRIASMGESGLAYGTHLHLGFFQGQPYAGQPNTPLNPLKTIYGQ